MTIKYRHFRSQVIRQEVKQNKWAVVTTTVQNNDKTYVRYSAESVLPQRCIIRLHGMWPVLWKCKIENSWHEHESFGQVQHIEILPKGGGVTSNTLSVLTWSSSAAFCPSLSSARAFAPTISPACGKQDSRCASFTYWCKRKTHKTKEHKPVLPPWIRSSPFPSSRLSAPSLLHSAVPAASALLKKLENSELRNNRTCKTSRKVKSKQMLSGSVHILKK